jgi:hypothetical protein
MENAIKSNSPNEFLENILRYFDKNSFQDLKKVKDLLSKTSTIVTNRLNQLEREVILIDEASDNFIEQYPDVQFLEPRGRYTVKITEKMIKLEGKAGIGTIPISNISQLCHLPSHTSAKKEGEDYLVLIFKEPVKIASKDYQNIVMNLSKSLPKVKGSSTTTSSASIKDEKDNQGGEGVEEVPPATESRLITLTIKKLSNLKVYQPNPRLFTSISQQKPYIRCYKGVSEGAIYPLSCGLLFFKPLIFIAADDIASFTAGRGGSSGNTRFVDLQVIEKLINSL